MKKLKLKLSAEAYSDLEQIWLYTFKKWSKEQADRYYILILDEINFLRSNPMAGKSAEQIRANYRVSFVKSHIVFYQADDKNLKVIRILHQSVEIEKWLS